MHHFAKSRWSSCPRESCQRLYYCGKLCWTIGNFVFCCSSSFHTAPWHEPWQATQQACPFPAGVVFLAFGEVEHIVHLIRWNLNSCLCHCGTTWPRSRRGVTHDFCCRWNWALCKLIVLVFHVRLQLAPHLVPNSPLVPLRNVSWGLGVCSAFVRSVSPRRMVLEVRSFPSPPCAVSACRPSSVSAFFFLLPFRVDPAPAGCVCVYVYVCVTFK